MRLRESFIALSESVSFVLYIQISRSPVHCVILALGIKPECASAVSNGLSVKEAESSPMEILLYNTLLGLAERALIIEERNAFIRESRRPEFQYKSSSKSKRRLGLTDFWFSFISINIFSCSSDSIFSKATTGIVFLSLY